MSSRAVELLKTACVALGTTSIYLLWLLAPLISQRHNAVYHWSGRAAGLFVPPIFDFCAFWLLLTLLLMLRRSHRREDVGAE